MPTDRFGTGFGKPKFPKDITLDTSLADFVGPSWFLFHILKMNSSFLTQDVDIHPDLPDYKASLNNIQAINIIYNCAERSIKLSSDLFSKSKKKMHYQNMLRVVEADRKQTPDL